MNPAINLATVLDLHAKWWRGEGGGQRANLQGANLRGADLQRANLQGADLRDADLRDADLQGADLQGANLRGANLRGANLRGANLQGAYLQGAYLQGANLRGANLRGANLQGADLQDANLRDADLRDADLQGADLQDANLQRADLQRADLRGANLQRADLQRADLQGADLQGANGSELALAVASHLPDGGFTAWKKCAGNKIIKLFIPEDAKRSHGTSRKCRAEFADVLEIYNQDGSISAESAYSNHDKKFAYIKGQRVKPDSWDDDRWNTCAGGIHFFITRIEAENYSF